MEYAPAHRTLIVRALKGLDHVIGVSVVHWFLDSEGWSFKDGEGVIPDTVNHAHRLRELYLKTDPSYEGRVTVPVLWDKKLGRIVNNESADIIRMFNSEFNALARNPDLDLYPVELRPQIDEINTWIYDSINNGVYKCGFAGTQEAYTSAAEKLFESLARVDEILSRQRYLVGDRLTEADVRLWTTLVRFDPVYHGHFKCNVHRVEDRPALLGFLRELYQIPRIAQTVDMGHIKRHYYQSHTFINPSGIVPLGNGPDLSRPHGRDHLRAQPVPLLSEEAFIGA